MSEEFNVDAIIGWPVRITIDGRLHEGYVSTYDPETGRGDLQLGTFVLKGMKLHSVDSDHE